MKRLPQIGKELNVAVTRLLEYCHRLGHEGLSPHSKIDPQLENQIIDLHRGEINNSELGRTTNFQVSSVQELPSEFHQDNPFELEQQKIISDSRLFADRNERIVTNEESELKTIFSDFEAYSICSGLDDGHSRHLARKFFKNQSQTESEEFEAHSIAMAALNKYGGKALAFFVSLPPLPFKAVNAAQIFSELDKRRKKQDYPILRITFKNDRNQTEKIQISYYAEKFENGRRRNDNVLSVKNRTTGRNLMLVSRNGIVIPETTAKQLVPVLQVFIRFSNDTKQTILNYGLETGECSICGRELTDSESIRIGIGPICMGNI
jgi:hypothetical protein